MVLFALFPGSSGFKLLFLTVFCCTDQKPPALALYPAETAGFPLSPVLRIRSRKIGAFQ